MVSVNLWRHFRLCRSRFSTAAKGTFTLTLRSKTRLVVLLTSFSFNQMKEICLQMVVHLPSARNWCKVQTVSFNGPLNSISLQSDLNSFMEIFLLLGKFMILVECSIWNKWFLPPNGWKLTNWSR